jgi:hypothetical protein
MPALTTMMSTMMFALRFMILISDLWFAIVRIVICDS